MSGSNDYIMATHHDVLAAIMALALVNVADASDSDLASYLAGFHGALTVLRLSPEYLMAMTYALRELPLVGEVAFRQWMRDCPIEVS